MRYIETLIDNCEKAKAAVPVKEFVVSEMSELDNIGTAIYIIEEIDGDPEKTFMSLSNYKKTKERACPKLNAASPVMYVGSSTTGVRKRIEQHLGDGPAGTYALHLKHWFKGKHKITIKIFDQPIEVIQIVEDALSHELSPAFGKSGGNNK
ncbi:hypothetical protein [Rheinheimera sp. UJ63]|uniref:hypothetical protein n=1 Tax=Rheinheimera sp. UJ63 TaxID=2910157 RepID=UPI001F1D5A84|nr:hypothetical protein [Rheinheimera sp. UJ63]MCF4009594.1 hypothetical protein [Rheinheimera sp. UJ63]